MLDFLYSIFSAEGFPRRWDCGSGWRESPVVGWLHIVSDIGIWSAYFAIPCILVYFTWRRRDLPFRTIFWLFGAFILACGTTHLMDAIIFWWPGYRLAGVIKLATALVSWTTVVALVPVIPKALTLRSPRELEWEIANRRRAEEALRQSVPTLHALIQSSPVAITTVNPAGEVLIWNDAAERTLGWTGDEVLGRPLPPFRVSANGQETLESIFAQRPDEPVPGEEREIRCRRKDGSEIDVSLSTAPVQDAHGRVLGRMAMLADVTEPKRAQSAWRRLTAIVEHSDDAILSETLDGTIETWNRGAQVIFGYTPDEAIGKNVSLIIPFDRAQELPGFRKRLMAGESIRNHETQSKRKDGSLVDVAITLSPLLDEQGKVIGASKIIRDITHTKLLHDKIQHAQKLESLGILAGGIAHDFNNLLMGILGGADLALMEMSPQAPGRECIDVIQKSAVRAAELCHQMLAYSGKGKFVVRPINLSELVEEMSHLLEVSISKRAVLKYHFAENLPLVEVDATQIRQVVMNLIMNASDAIGDKSGVITVSTGAIEADKDYLSETYLDDDLPEGCYVYVEVSDTGCGMDEETKSRIFDPFFTTKFTGRGLGLAAVLGIVRGHRGALKIYSQVGRGTTMKVLFPCSDETQSSSLQQGKDHADDWKASGKVLVVDDDETVLVVAKRMLENHGFEVLTAGDGTKGVELFQAYKDEIVLVLLDMTMPHMDGDEAFREMRRIRGDARVILSSGYNEQDATNRFAGKGLAGFIQKPYRTNQLLAKVRETLGIV